MMSPVELHQGINSDFFYSDMAIGWNYAVLYTDDESIEYEDYELIAKMRVGVLTGGTLKRRYSSWAIEHGVNTNFVEFNNEDQMKEDLANGFVDAILLSSYHEDQTLKMIARVDYCDDYFMISRMRPDIKSKIDEAMTRILISSPDFQTDLEHEYYTGNNIDPISKADHELISSIGTVRVAVATDRRPMLYQDEDGNVTGIAIELMDQVAEKTGLQFEYVACANGEAAAEALKSGDCQLKIPAGAPANEKYGLSDMVTSDSLTESTLSAVSVGGVDPTMKDSWTIGITEDSIGMGQAFLSKYSNCSVLTFTDWNAACKAMLAGKVDAVAVNSASASYLLQKPEYGKLSLVSTISIGTPVSAGGNAEYSDVISIINKGIKLISIGDIQNTYTKYTSLHNYKYTLEDYIFVYRDLIVSLAVVLVLIIFFIVHYIVARKRYEAKLMDMNRQLAAASTAKSEFLSNMSHDIRTPISTIMGITSLAMDETDDPVAMQRELTEINHSSEYLLGIINDILDMSRIENRKFALEPDWVMLDKVMNTCVRLISPEMEKKNIVFEHPSFDEVSDVECYADSIKFDRMMMNILNNACKFTDKGGHVKLDFACEKHRVSTARGIDAPDSGKLFITITISDNGCGMSEEFLKSAFTPFAQERNKYSADTRGTGLGLVLARQIAVAMDGDISVKSKLGEGSIFTIRVQCTYRKNSEDAAGAAATERAGDTGSDIGSTEAMTGQSDAAGEMEILNGKHILVCEDNTINAEIVKRLLEKKGCIVDIAENGKAAVDKFGSSITGYYDAILMDIRMPVMDGIEATEYIRSLNRKDSKTIVIIAMSANAFREDIDKSLAAGMNAHLAKPVSPEAMFEELARDISRKEK